MKKLYKLLLICLLTIAGGGNALKAQSYNSDNSETANRAETPTYISKIAVAYGAEASTPKDILKNNGFTIIDKDLNAGCGSHTHYIYMGYKTTTNPADAITGIYIREGNDTPNSATFDGVTAYLLGGSTEDNPGENKPVDLNIDAGGATLHVYVSRNTNLAAITDIKFSNTNSMSGYVTQNIDLNKGASGEYIYLHYKQYSAQVYANFHYINESCQSVSKKFYGTLLHHLDDVEITPSIPTLLTYDDRSLAFMSWKDNTEAMVDYEYTSKININLESSGMTFYGLYYFSPQTPLNLRFDANGGTGAPEDQKTDIYGLRYLNAGNGTPVYELSTFQIPNNICTKVGTCKFLGWSTDPNANSAEYQPGQSIDIALNTTLYAIYDSAHEYENGYCSICGAYEPAELVNGYYQIKTADNLFWFAEYVNTIDRTASAKLMNDIDLENRPWTPIGTTGESSHNFRGHFDGNGKTITGLNVEVTRSGGGFFGEVRLGTVEDFTIYGEVKLNGNHSYVGGVIGSAPGANSNQPEHNGATIRNITSYVNVTLGEGSHGSNRVAGFIGYANHETLIENCTWYGTLDLDAYRAQDGVGGLVGKANDNSEITIRNCAAYGTIKTSYQSGSYNSHNSIYIGGIVSNSVASAQTTLENCIWAGTLIDNTNLGSNAHISAIGTLDGSKSVSNCYALDNMPYITTNNAHNTGITEVTAEQLASGEIAYKLQGTQATQIWGQNIDNGETADSKPILGGAKVYEIIYSGGGIYTNTIITASGRCGNNLYWKVSDNTLTIFGTGAMNNYSGTGHIAPWRSLNPAPTSLVLEEGITHIGDYAFYDCSGLTGSLTIPNSVTTIGTSAFENCSSFTGNLTIPNSVTYIGNLAFYKCSGFNGSLTIPNSVTYIGKVAFRDCSGFTGDLTIGNSVTSIEELTFYNCKGFSGSLTIGNSVTTIGRSAFEFCSGFKGSLIIGNSVTSIGNGAFEYCEGFTGSLTIPNSVKTIGEYAFYECTSFDGTLTIGNSVTSIEKCAFYFCTGFTEVYSLAKTAPTLGTYPFGYIDRNAYLYYPASCEQSYNEKGWFDIFSNNANGPCGDNLYWTVRDNILNIFGAEEMWDYDNSDNKAPWRSLNPAPTSLVLKEGVSHIGDYAFYNCSNFTEVYSWDETAPTLGIDAFKDANSNATLYYPVSSYQSYDENGWFNYFPQHIGFYGRCGDNLYWIVDTTNTLTILGTGAMYDYSSNYDPAPWCSLNPAPTSLVLEEGITYIGRYAFAQCSNLTGDLTIPNSVNTIEDYAFGECSGFTDIFFYRDANPTIGTSVFSGINAKAKFYVPVIWKSFSNIPSGNLVKMPTFVGQQSSSTVWVGLAEDQTWPDEDDHVAINAPLVLGSQQDNKTTRQQGRDVTPVASEILKVKSFGLCGNENTTNGSITIEDGGQLYCEVARGEVTVKKEIVGYAETTRQQDNKTTSESVWYTIASPLKDTLLISDPQFLNSSVPQFLSSNSDLYRYDEPSYTWQNAKNSANNGFNTIDPGRGYLYANAENTSLEFTGMINTDDVTYNLTAKSNVLKGFHLIGNPFTYDIYLGESIKTKETQNIIFELNDSYGDGWNGNALNLSFSDETPGKTITIESGKNSKTEINVGSGVIVTVSFTRGNYPGECSFTIKYDDETVICDKYSNEGSLESVENGATLTTFTVREGIDVLVNGYYTLTGEGAWAAEASTTEAIKPMQSILVKSLVDDIELPIFNTINQPSAVSRQQYRNGQQTTDNSQQSLCISVANAKYSDRAFVVFDKGVGLDKMNHENENIPLLYIPMEDADYAIAMMDINVNEIPVNFETNVMGEYTISLRQENCEFSELYLLDKETDEKVNILEQDYTFIATSSDNPERFVLIKDNGQQTTDNRPWVYVNNGDIVIYNIEGDADIKIFDALGRCVYHGESSDETTRIANGYSSGVFMIQKVDDKGVKVQKIIL